MSAALLRLSVPVAILLVGYGCTQPSPKKSNLGGGACVTTVDCSTGFVCIDGNCAVPPENPMGDPDAQPTPDGGNDAGEVDASPDAGRTVADLPGLVLWLDAAKGITKDATSAVSAWADQSAAKNDASQPLAARQPTYVANVINGLPAVHGSVDTTVSIAPSASLLFGNGDFAISAVFRATTPTSTIYSCTAPLAGPPSGLAFQFFPSDGAKTNVIGVTLSGAITVAPVTTSTQNLNDNVARLITVRRAGTTVELRIGGVSDTSSTTTTNAVDVSTQSAASYTIKVLGLDGDLAEILAVKGSLPAADLVVLEGYLKTKYGL